MNIPVLIEPTPTGFRASTGAPLHLVAEAADADAAVNAITSLAAAKLQAGCRIVNVGVEAVRHEEAWTRLAANPLFDEWVGRMKEYRQEREAEEEAADAARAAEFAEKNGLPVSVPTASNPERAA